MIFHWASDTVENAVVLADACSALESKCATCPEIMIRVFREPLWERVVLRYPDPKQAI